MDSLSQAALGAAIGEAMLGKRIGNKGALIGAIVATIPDLDVLIIPFYSDVARISIHRGYSHSILFSIVGAFILTYILTRFRWGRDLSKARVWLFTWLALFTHMLLDAFTTYGTQLLLPFSDYRVSFDSINIVDPLYTVPLLVGLLGSLWVYRNSKQRRMFNTVGLIVSTIYLLGTLGIKHRVVQEFEATLRNEGIVCDKLLKVPVGMSGINWYGVAKTDDGIFMGKYSNWADNIIELTYFPTQDELLTDIDPVLAECLKWFAKDYYTVARSENGIRFYNLQCDMQGIQKLELGEKAPTAFYFEVIQTENGEYDLEVGLHQDR